MQPGSNYNNNIGHHSSHNNNYFSPPTTTNQYLFQQQQLLPFNSNAASNSAHSSPLKRSQIAQQAVSPLASPMESRRVFMATHPHQQQQHSGESPPPQLNGQMLGPPVGLSAVQLGYAIPACRLLVDPHTGQQFFVPTVSAAPQPLAATAATPTFFQPIYSQPTAAAYYQPHTANFTSNNNRQRQHQQQLISPSSSPPNQQHQRHLPQLNSTTASQGPFLYNIGHPQQLNTSSTDCGGFYSQQQQHSSSHHHHYASGGPHRSQSPLSTSPRDDRLEDSSTSGLPYRVEMPPSTGGSVVYNDERRRQSNDTAGHYEIEAEESSSRTQQCGRMSGYNTDRTYQQQNFQRREHARLSTESRQSNSTRGDSGRGGLMFGSPDNNSDIEDPSPRSRGYYSSYSPPPLSNYYYNKQLNYNQNNQMMMSTSTIIGGGGASGSSDSTSGFVSVGGGENNNKNYNNRKGGGGTIFLEEEEVQQQHSPLFSSPNKQQQQGMFGCKTNNNNNTTTNSSSSFTFASSPPFRTNDSTPPQQQTQSRMKSIRMDIDLSSSGLASDISTTPLEGKNNKNNGDGINRNSRPSSFCNNFASGNLLKGAKEIITATTTATTISGESELSVRATVLRTAPPTAFTISFNDESAQLGGKVSISEVSLQEAAQKAPKGRRLMLERKSEQQQDSGSECGGDPKRWLFRKMMMGRRGEVAKSCERRRRRSGSAISEATTSTTMSGGGRRNENEEDLASEAGTYVVENDKKAANNANIMTTSQISGVSNTSSNRTTQQCYDSDSDSSTNASTRTSSTGRTSSPNHQISTKTTLTTNRPPITISGPVVKRSLMNDLRQLREGGQIDKSITSVQQSSSLNTCNAKINKKFSTNKTVGVFNNNKNSNNKPLAPPVPPHRCGGNSAVSTTNNSQKKSVATTNPPIPFSRPCRCPSQHQQQQQQQNQQQQAFSTKMQNSRCRSEPRNDGGRFSMRPTSATRANALLRQTASSNAAKLKAAEEEKMLGWLRRKEYDARRAVAEAEQQQQQSLKKQQEAFTSNRSISATLTNIEQQKQQQQSSFSRWKIAQQQQTLIKQQPLTNLHRSHDELSRLAEAYDDEDSSLLTDSCNTSLQKTVDELTQKCHKSIALLKLCNQSSLSPSVEHLLERVANIEGKEGQLNSYKIGTNSGVSSSNENISDRLEQLNSAFDAIQKYLEEQTTTSISCISSTQQQQSPQRTFSGTFVVKKNRGGVSLDIADDTLKYQKK